MKSIFSRIDYYLLIPALIVVFLSFFILSSFQYELAQAQALYACVGLIIFFGLQIFKPIDLKSSPYPVYFFILLLLLAVFAIGEVSRGSNRWIPVWGELRIQPSEFAKPALILLLAKFFSDHYTFLKKNIIYSAIATFIYFILVFKQPDLGTALTFIVIWLTSLYLLPVSLKKMITVSVLVCLAGILVGPIAWNSLHDYQRDRILVFLDPQRDPLGKGYNALQALITVGSGGSIGKGFGMGTQSHNNFLPEQYTDFAFATYSEEFGFVGVIVLLVLYSLILWRIFKIAGEVKSRFSFFICVSTAMFFFFQVFINIGMNIGIMPITGITLPLFSYGGSSLISFFICLGLVQAVKPSENY
jgi:rod shape determining protein RodA